MNGPKDSGSIPTGQKGEESRVSSGETVESKNQGSLRVPAAFRAVIDDMLWMYTVLYENPPRSMDEERLRVMLLEYTDNLTTYSDGTRVGSEFLLGHRGYSVGFEVFRPPHRRQCDHCLNGVKDPERPSPLLDQINASRELECNQEPIW